MNAPSHHARRYQQMLVAMLCTWGALEWGAARPAHAEVSSSPAILQMFEASWGTVENRMADIFGTGYGKMWLPPPERAGPSGSNVGYEVYDRFDLGQPGNPTLYGTEAGLKGTIATGHTAGMQMFTDLVPNHDGTKNQNTPGFASQGGYNGFALSVLGDPYGDFHNPSITTDTDLVNGSLLGLIDIAQEKNYTFIRQPVAAGNPNNIPAGTIYNKTDPNNARFYPDQALGGLVLDDPQQGTQVTHYSFNLANPLAGDAVSETAMGYLMRNAQWMVQVIGADGFRVDSSRTMPLSVHTALDQAVFRANPRLQLDGSIQPVFFMGEVYDGSKTIVQSLIRKDLPNPLAISPSNTTVGGDRDALDFPLFFALQAGLTNSNSSNNWTNIRTASVDTNDKAAGDPVWASDGSQGVAFVQNHDLAAPYLVNVGYAYTLMRPGNAIVYTNAKEFGNNRSFPQSGKIDALGGFYGDTITKLVDLRNTHGRGNFLERSTSTEVYIYERQNSAIVGLSNRVNAGTDTRTNVQTGFAPGTVLVELTGNAANPTVDPGGVVPEAIRVNASGQINIIVPRNSTHGLGYVIYGLAGPQGAISLDGTSGVLAGATPTAANNGTARLTDLSIVNGDSLTLHLNTTPVTLPAPAGESNPVRDFHADGDSAMFKIDGGLDLNNNGMVDVTTPGDVAYGFENFTTSKTAGYIYNGSTDIGSGFGTYTQSIDTTQLSEGRHYITVRAFRHRDAATGGDGGPAVFTDFRQTIYVDRLPPVSVVVSFAPDPGNPGNLNSRNLITRSVDETADRTYVLLDQPANMSNAQVMQMAINGQNTASVYDRAQWSLGFVGVTTGNHVATVVTLEPTYDGTHGFNVQRIPNLFTQTSIGAGFGDMNANGQLEIADLSGSGGFEQVLYSQNAQFNAAADVTGDGLVDDRDLIALGPKLVAKGASAAVMTEFDNTLRRRADMNGNGSTDLGDLTTLYAQYGTTSWQFDLNVDGVVNALDSATLVTQLLRTSPGDYNLDGTVDAADYTIWRDSLGTNGAIGDGNFDGKVDGSDYGVWQAAFGFQRGPITAGSGADSGAAVPEPSTGASVFFVLAAGFAVFGRRQLLRME
jgi:alpha-amylase